LHTNDAPGAVTRLLDMGVEPFQIASTLEAVLAQRLVRRICRQCCRVSDQSAQARALLGIDSVCYEGAGCAVCGGTGYRGRTGIYEWLRMSEEVRDLVISRAPTRVLRQKAIEQGMQTLRENALAAVVAGVTTAAEVQKCT
jgi:type IV pilus assembly protein PilB